MERSILLLALSAALATGTVQKCNKDGGQTTATTDQASVNAVDADLTAGAWLLSTLVGKPIELPEGVPAPSLNIGTDGSVSGFGGCNRFSGQAQLKIDKLSLPGLMRTKMYCAAVQATEDAFMGALGATNAYRITGNTLVLLDKEKELATLVRR